MRRTVAIDFLPESVNRYRRGWAIVVVDVIRATTTAITAVAAGRRCFPVPSKEAALAFAQNLNNPLLGGESGGERLAGFEVDNSPAQLAARTDIHRPLVLVSSSGTKVIHEATGCEAVYLACFRNFSAVAAYLKDHCPRVAVIGAGTKGEFREEDQMCCSWIAGRLIQNEFAPENPETLSIIDRWRGAPPRACLCSHSADFLIRTGRLDDLNYILGHIDDLSAIFSVSNGEVTMTSDARNRLPDLARAQSNCRKRFERSLSA